MLDTPEPEVSSHQSMVQSLFLKDGVQSNFVFRDATSWHPKGISGQEGGWFCSLNTTQQTPSQQNANPTEGSVKPA